MVTGGPPLPPPQIAICYLRNTGANGPREAIGPKGSNCFSREVLAVLMTKTLNRTLPLPEGIFWIRLRIMSTLRQQYSYMISSNKHQKTRPHFYPGLPDLATLVVYELGREEQRKTRTYGKGTRTPYLLSFWLRADTLVNIVNEVTFLNLHSIPCLFYTPFIIHINFFFFLN